MIAMEPPIEHRDVTTIMALLGSIDEASLRSAVSWRTTMAKKHRKMTPEERARQEEIRRRAPERIAFREAQEREHEARSAERGV